MSWPRLSRTVACTPAARSSAWKRAMRAGGLGAKPAPGKGLKGIRFTFARSPRSHSASRRASASVSFSPASMTYSKVMRWRRGSGAARRKERRERPAAVDGHQAAALGVGGGRERDREVDARFGDEARDVGHEP